MALSIDEKGFTQSHSPPSVVCGSQNPPQAVTVGTSNTTTFIKGVGVPLMQQYRHTSSMFL